MGYEFTTDWVSANRADWERMLTALEPESYLEVGCFEGRNVCTMLEACPRLKEVVCLDAWKDDPLMPGQDMSEARKRFDANILHASEKRRAKGFTECEVASMRGSSFSLLCGLIDQLILEPLEPHAFDLIYIDGSHMPEDCLEDMVLASHLLRVGGVMVVDDYLWTFAREGREPGDDLLHTPKIAIDAFTTIYRRSFTILPRQSLYQVFLAKTKER